MKEETELEERSLAESAEKFKLRRNEDTEDARKAKNNPRSAGSRADDGLWRRATRGTNEVNG